MAKEKNKRVRLSFDKDSIDPAVCCAFFNSVCQGDRKLAGELVNEFMRKACKEYYGRSTEMFIESIRRHLEK